MRQDTRSALEATVPIHHLFHGEGGNTAQNGLAERTAQDLIDPTALRLRLLSLLGYHLVVSTAARCITSGGAWALDLDSRGARETGDIDDTVDFTVNTLGDPGFIAEYDPQAHGSGAQRSQSILLGYSDGFLGCNIVI